MNVKELEKILKLCRKQGVQELSMAHESMGTIAFKLGDLPIQTKASDIESGVTNPYDNFPTGDLTPTQLMFYSSGGMPEDDPELRENQSQ